MSFATSILSFDTQTEIARTEAPVTFDSNGGRLGGTGLSGEFEGRHGKAGIPRSLARSRPNNVYRPSGALLASLVACGGDGRVRAGFARAGGVASASARARSKSKATRSKAICTRTPVRCATS